MTKSATLNVGEFWGADSASFYGSEPGSILCVSMWLWSVASAVGTRTGAMSRCILAVYTSYKRYLVV